MDDRVFAWNVIDLLDKTVYHDETKTIDHLRENVLKCLNNNTSVKTSLLEMYNSWVC